MMRSPLRTSFLGLMLVAGGSSSAGAGALYLNEFATPSMGVAGAGQEAVAEDASTNFAFHNPAGMTRLKAIRYLWVPGFWSGKPSSIPMLTRPLLAAMAVIRRVWHRSWGATAY